MSRLFGLTLAAVAAHTAAAGSLRGGVASPSNGIIWQTSPSSQMVAGEGFDEGIAVAFGQDGEGPVQMLDYSKLVK